MILRICEAKQKLKDALSAILEDAEAAEWIVGQRNVETIRQRFTQKTLALVSFDVDKIKDLVFASTKPLEVQGASEIVRDLTVGEKRSGQEALPDCSIYSIAAQCGLSPANVLFAGGGTGLLLVPSHKAGQIAEEIRRRFADHSATGSCAVVWREFFPHELITGPEDPSRKMGALPPGVSIISGNGDDTMKFGRIIQLLADQLRAEKDQKLTPPFPILPGYVHVCESCGVRAAACYDRGQGICQSCQKHRQRGRDERSYLRKYHRERRTAQDVNEIACTATGERGYVAFIYSDANDMGQILFDLDRMEEYAVFSRAVRHVMEGVTQYLVVKYDLAGQYQSPIIGGDDILMIVPASKAARIVSDLTKKVGEEFCAIAKQIGHESSTLPHKLRNITMSTGFAIVPSHFDIRFSVDYAAALLYTAKRRRYENYENRDQDDQEYVDWMIIKDGSPLSTNVSSLRENAFVRESVPKWKLTLTDKPVMAGRFHEMLEWIRLLKKHGVSRHQLRNMQLLLERESPRVAMLNIRYQWLRASEWKSFFQALGALESPMSREEWMESFVMRKISSDIYKTGFVDMLELYEFAEAQP